MIIKYDNHYLEELYDTGKCKDKRIFYQPQVIRKYQKRIDTLMAATRIEDLFAFNSLNFEAIKESGYYSIRIDIHYRLEFTVEQQEGEAIISVCTIKDISNHYQ